MKRTGNQFLTLTLVTMHIAATAAAEQGPVPTADKTAGAQAASLPAPAGGARAPDGTFPRVVIGHAMLWGTPHSARFRPGYVPSDAPGYTGSGFYENAPLVPADTPDAGKDDRAHFPKAWFEDLRNAGIDAVDHCYFDSIPITTLLETMEAAKASDTGIKVLPTMDQMPKTGPTFLVDLWKNEMVRNHPNLLRAGDQAVVSSFGVHGGDVWRKRLAAAAEVGGKYFVISDVSESGPGYVNRPVVPDDFEPVQCLYNFMDIWAAGLPSLSERARSYTPPKRFGGGVVPGYIGSTRQGIIIGPHGTETFRRNWMQCINHSPDFVYLSTLNDYTEATEQECSANSTYTFLDMNAYFGARWKTGQWPALAKPQAFLSYRKAVALTEAVEFELVLLRPELTGKEEVKRLAEQFQARLTLTLNGTQTVALEPVLPEVFPGHLVWRFWAKGPHADGYAVPSVKITAEGVPLPLPSGASAPFAIVRNGEQVARRWLHVPLHRLRTGVAARVGVTSAADKAYPRTLRVEGLPWDDVACAVLEREANSLSPALTAGQLRAGFTEELYAGPGWCPMPYLDGNLKRNVVDQVDRYTAVIRMNDNTFVFPTPALLAPPRELKNEPFVDPATVTDLTISPGKKLADRGWMRRDLALPEGNAQPAIRREGDGPWFLGFDGADDVLRNGPFFMPPGPATVELSLRPGDTQRTQTIFDSSEPVLSLVLMPGGTLRLLRMDQQRKIITLEGRTALMAGKWHHVSAVFTGSALRLYVDGIQDGADVPLHGLRADKESAIGGPALWADGIRATGHFRGDIKAFRVLQRFLAPEEVAARFDEVKRVR